MIVAQLTDRSVRYKVDATIAIGDDEPARIGGATSASTRHSMTQFWYPLPPGVSLDDREVTIEVYEEDSTGTQALVRTFTLGT